MEAEEGRALSKEQLALSPLHYQIPREIYVELRRMSEKPIREQFREAVESAATEASNLPDNGSNYAERLAADFILGRVDTEHKFESQDGFLEIETLSTAIDAVGEWVTWLTDDIIEKSYEYGKNISDAVYLILCTDRMYELVGSYL